MAGSVQLLVLRTSRGPLEPAWRATYGLLARIAARWLTAGRPGAAAYIRGSVAEGDPLYGLADIDLVVVAPGDPADLGAQREAVRRRWRAWRRLPVVGRLVSPHVYEDWELRRAASATTFTHALDGPPSSDPDHDALYRGRQRWADDAGLLVRPGLSRPTGDWRRIAGPDRRPALPEPDPQARRIAAWLELQYLWRHAMTEAAQPTIRTAQLCVKLVADSLRIWLWLVHGEREASRRATLQRGLEALPAEEEAIRFMLDVERRLPRSPAPPLAESLGFLVRHSARLAQRIAEEVEPAGSTPVRLVGTGEDELALPAGARERLAPLLEGEPPRLLPLCDHRALTNPPMPDESFAIVPGDPADPATLARAGIAGREGTYPVLRAGRLLVFAAAELWARGLLRSVQLSCTDPVSHALAAGASVAHFPSVRGWSAADKAVRAVAEHRAWLSADIDAAASPAALAGLLTAARAALFAESLAAGDAELSLTLRATAATFGARTPQAASVAAEAADAMRAWRAGGPEPPAALIAPLRAHVLRLAPYAPAP